MNLIRRKVVLALFVFGVALLFGGHRLAYAIHNNDKAFDYNVTLHELDVEIDVVKHSIRAKDKMHVEFDHENSREIGFLLNDNLEIKKIRIENGDSDLKWAKSDERHKIQMIRVQLPTIKGKSAVLSIEYEGEIYDPVITAKELGHLRGDVTAGLISEKGVYLSNSSYWYPMNQGGLSLFNMTTKIVDPYRVVTQGELKERNVKDGFAVSRWESHIPADGLALVAGKFIIHTKKVGDIDVSSYFFKEDDAMSGLFLDAAVDYLKIYSELLGTYPYKKFDVVENFFSTGYGMPSYTLLGNYVIKRGKGALHPGYLDHEIVHSWFGNYVFNDALKGNWVEALTTYCANYYYKEMKMGADEALKHRKNASLKYSIRVSGSADYPVDRFVTKIKASDNEIGYTKGSMVFHQLRMTIGDENFFKALKLLVKDFGGKYAEWKDLQAVFETVSKQKLEWFFKQWVKSGGSPELRLDSVKATKLTKGYMVEGVIYQGMNIYKLNLTMYLEFENGDNKIFNLDIDNRNTPFKFEVDTMPVSVSIDPEYHVFKRIAPEDINPCLNALLEEGADNKYFISSQNCSDMEKDVYGKLVMSAKGRTGGVLVNEAEINPEVLSGSIFIAGKMHDNRFLKVLFAGLPKEIELGDDSFSINGEVYKGPEYSILFSFRNPLNKSNFITTYFGHSAQAISRSHYIFFYGWDGYVVFKNGRPVSRGSFEQKGSKLRYDFEQPQKPVIKSENIMEHIKFLASEKLAGRYAGSEGDLLAREYIRKSFQKSGVSAAVISGKEPFEQRFDISIKDIDDFAIEFKNKKKSV